MTVPRRAGPEPENATLSAGRRFLAAWAVAVAGSVVIARSLPADAPKESPRTVRYDLDARLDPEAHVVHGSGTIAWKSDAIVAVPTLRFHLYLNAFRDEHSTFLTERAAAGPGGGGRRGGFDPRRPGGIDVTSLTLADGTDLLAKSRYVVEEGGAAGDRTVLEVTLPTPVEPGQELVTKVAFDSRLPHVVARTGFGGDFHFAAQWFPKLGVWQDVGEGGAAKPGWCCPAYHAQTEFFADYGVYDVRIHVPAAYQGRVGATGKLDPAGAKREADGTLTYAFHADDVHDFAWVAGSEGTVVLTHVFEGGRGVDVNGDETARAARALGRSPRELALPAVDVTFLLRPEHADQAARHVRAIDAALTYMGLWFGPYPYPTLTVVDPDFRAGVGGMEYPTLITGGTGHVLADRGINPEFVLIHEFGHQHFYGLLGTNEFKDAWMDEGFNTYGTAKVLEKAYGPRAMASIRWYAGLPSYGEPPLEFGGVVPGLRSLFPALGRDVVPFGRLSLVRDVAGTMGGEPPDEIALWPAGEDVSPLQWWRELPPLTHLKIAPHTMGEHERRRYADWPDTDDLSGRWGWQYLDGLAYGNQSYRRTANVLRTLEGWIGDEAMLRVMRTYAERFRFRHPTPVDFERTASEVAGQDLTWFFQNLVRDHQVLDFGIHEIRVGEKDERGVIESTVVVRRLGGARFPTTVHVRFADGSIRRLRWGLDDRVTALDGLAAPETHDPPAPAGQYRWVKIVFRGPSPVDLAETDPERRVSLEVDRTNDGRRVDPDSRASWRLSVRALGFTEMLTTFYGGL